MVYLALIVGTIASAILGFVWYGPLFGKIWQKHVGLPQEFFEEQKKKGSGRTIALNLLSQFITACVTLTLLRMLGVTTVIGAWEILTLVWLGFSFPVELGNILWTGKSGSLLYINTAYRLLSYLIMGISIILIAY